MNTTPTLSFIFEGNPVRSVLIDGDPWFVGRDVALVLGYAKPENAISRHCRGTLKRGIPTTSGVQEMAVIAERDVYRLIFSSKLPAAERFEDWVVSEVLPSIRKRGVYLEGQQKIRAELLDALAENIRDKALPALREFDRRTEHLHWLALSKPHEHERRYQLVVDSIALDFDLPRSLVEALTRYGMSVVATDQEVPSGR